MRRWAADPAALQRRRGKLTHVGDQQRLGLWRRLLRGETAWTPRDRRLCDMLWVVLYGGKLAASGEAAERFQRHQAVRAELAELIEVLERLNGVLAHEHELAAAVPLVLHARYLAGELAAAFGVRTKDGELREAYYTGVEAVRDGGREYDLLLVTLQKAAGVKEHLRYQDFALGERRFHWQSKAATTVESKEGRRHRLAEELGVTPLLLVREREREGNGTRTAAFQYLGPVKAGSWSGERPMTVEWEVGFAMPVVWRDWQSSGVGGQFKGRIFTTAVRPTGPRGTAVRIAPMGLPKAASGARLWSAPRGSAGGKMPEVSRFFGILISINYNDHAPPHFHVR